MPFAQINVVDDVTTHEVGSTELHGVSIEAGRERKDVVRGNRHKGMLFGEGQRKGVELEEPEHRIRGYHWDVKQNIDVTAIEEV